MKKDEIIKNLSTTWEIQDWGLPGEYWSHEEVKNNLQKLNGFNFTFQPIINELLSNNRFKTIIINNLKQVLKSMEEISNFSYTNSLPSREPNCRREKWSIRFDGETKAKAEPLVKAVQDNVKFFYHDLLNLIKNNYQINEKIFEQYQNLENHFNNFTSVKRWLIDLIENTNILDKEIVLDINQNNKMNKIIKK